MYRNPPCASARQAVALAAQRVQPEPRPWLLRFTRVSPPGAPLAVKLIVSAVSRRHRSFHQARQHHGGERPPPPPPSSITAHKLAAVVGAC